MARSLKKGNDINGYVLCCDGTTAGSGTAQWAFCTKDGVEYFIKQFLSPVYPSDTAPGKAETKQKRRVECDRFEERTRAVERALGACADGGFLVRAHDFFRFDGFYYKVTNKIEIDPIDLKYLEANSLWLTLLTVVFSVRMLHERSAIVHADLKPENIILQRHDTRLIARLIDFDASFFEADPPTPAEIVGDQLYRAPEMLRYLKEETHIVPTRAVDVFAAGLILHLYITGSLPQTKSGKYAAESLLEGESLQLCGPRHAEFATCLHLIEGMLAADPYKRPTMGTVHEQLLGQRAAARSSATSFLVTSGASMEDSSVRSGVTVATEHSGGVTETGASCDASPGNTSKQGSRLRFGPGRPSR